jgi:hypothetical protein
VKQRDFDALCGSEAERFSGGQFRDAVETLDNARRDRDPRRGTSWELDADDALLTLEKPMHGRWAGWTIPHACHTAENEKSRKRTG